MPQLTTSHLIQLREYFDLHFIDKTTDSLGT